MTVAYIANLFAAAGLAEAAWGQAVIMCWAAWAVIGLFALLGIVMRSGGLALGALALLLLASVFFTPWNAFTPFKAEAYEDPDVVDWAPKIKSVAYGWAGVSGLTAIGVMYTLYVTKLKDARSINQHQSPRTQ